MPGKFSPFIPLDQIRKVFFIFYVLTMYRKFADGHYTKQKSIIYTNIIEFREGFFFAHISDFDTATRNNSVFQKTATILPFTDTCETLLQWTSVLLLKCDITLDLTLTFLTEVYAY